MINKTIDINKKRNAKAVCFGSGLVALDVILNGHPNTDPKLLAGGSCGNVLSILAFLGWKSYPIARFSNRPTSDLVIKDFESHSVKTDLISQSPDGSTPVIIHRILKDANNNPKHRFEFKIPKTNIWLPSYKSVLSNKVSELCEYAIKPKVFYIDRVSRANIDLAKFYKANGGLIFFEPTSISDEKQFKECISIADIIKFSNDRLPQYKELYPTRQAAIEIETLGANGLLFRSFRNRTNEWKFLPALEIENVLDTAGAGDWCSAGLIHALFEDFETPVLYSLTNSKLEKALRYGQFMSALNCCYYGARGLMYNLKFSEVKKLYNKYESSGHISLKKREPGFNLRKHSFDINDIL